MDNKTIEEKVGSTILESDKTVIIDGETYNVAPPTTATLIMVSELVSKLPRIKMNSEILLEECLANAKDFRIIGEIAAILILGAKHYKETKKTRENKGKRLFRDATNLFCKDVSNVKQSTEKQLSNRILMSMSPRDLSGLIMKLLGGMQIADFFGITAFLTEVNLLRATKQES